MLAWFKKHLKTPASFDGPMVETDHFELKLSKSWKPEPTSDPEQFSFTANDGSVITISSMAWSVSADRLPAAAEVLMESRGQSLGEGLGGYKYEIDDFKVVPVPYPGLEIYAYGGAAEISYYSRTYALLTENFMLNLYVESPASTPKNNEAQFKAVMEGLGIKIPVEQANGSGLSANVRDS